MADLFYKLEKDMVENLCHLISSLYVKESMCLSEWTCLIEDCKLIPDYRWVRMFTHFMYSSTLGMLIFMGQTSLHPPEGVQYSAVA